MAPRARTHLEARRACAGGGGIIAVVVGGQGAEPVGDSEALQPRVPSAQRHGPQGLGPVAAADRRGGTPGLSAGVGGEWAGGRLQRAVGCCAGTGARMARREFAGALHRDEGALEQRHWRWHQAT